MKDCRGKMLYFMSEDIYWSFKLLRALLNLCFTSQDVWWIEYY